MIRTERHLGECGWFWAWTLAVPVAALAILNPLLVLMPLGFAVAAFARTRVARRTTFGLLTGAGLVCLAAAWTMAGVALLAGGIVAFAVAHRRARGAG